MPVIGISIEKVNAERKEVAMTGFRIDNKTNLTEVSKMPLEGLGREGLRIRYEFKSGYTDTTGKELGSIHFEGFVFYMDEKQNEILKNWEEKKSLPEGVNIEVINMILRKCLTRALSLSEDLQLPPPFGLPFATKDTKKK